MNLFDEISVTEKNLSTNPESIQYLTELMQQTETRKEIEKYLEKELEDDDIQNVKVLLDAAQSIYNYTGNETGMSDSEYDILYEKLSMKMDNIGITVPVVSTGDVVYHKYKSLRGTLDKIYALTEEDSLENKSRRSLDEWIKTSENKIYEKTGERESIETEEVYCFPKFDGVSAIFEFSSNGNLERVLTRGYTETNEAQDITHVFRGWVTGPFDHADHPYGLKTEIMMSDEDFEKYNETYHTDYKQSRSIVSSILNSDETDDRVNYLQIMQLRTSYLDDDGNESLQELAPGAFNVPYLKCRLCDREMMRNFAFAHKYVNGLRCDGMVIYIINQRIQKILGRENNKQKFEVAYKFTEEVGYSKIKDIIFETGLFGRIIPVAKIKPIKLKGNTIENISLGSYGRFKELNLAIGDTVKVLYDIIPYLVFDENDETCKRSGNEIIESPKYCHDCGEPLTESESGDMLQCTNRKCPSKIKGNILNFFNKMHIDGISYATVDTFYDLGYLKNIKDIYKLEKHKNELSNIPGFGPRSIQLILDEIDAHKEIPVSQLLGSLGIEGISTKTFEKVFSKISFDDLLEVCFEPTNTKAINVLSIVPGIKEKSAIKIIEGIRSNEKLIEFLENELILLEDKKPSSYDFSVVFTKVRDEDLEKWTVENHGKVDDSVKKDTSVVVVPMVGVTSSKTEKAEKRGIPIVPIKEYKEYVEKHFL